MGYSIYSQSYLFIYLFILHPERMDLSGIEPESPRFLASWPYLLLSRRVQTRYSAFGLQAREDTYGFFRLIFPLREIQYGVQDDTSPDLPFLERLAS